MLENLDFQVLRRRAWLLLAVMVIGALAALVLTSARDVEYESHAQLMVGPGIDSPNPDLNVLRASGQLIQMYAELPLTEPFLQNVIDEVGLDMRPSRLADYIEVQPNTDTLILTVTVTYTDPDIAAAISSSIADQLVKISPSNPDSPAAQIRAETQTQVDDLEATLAQIKDNIAQLQSDYQNVTAFTLPAANGQYADFMSDTLTQQQIADISGSAAVQSTTGLDILQELVNNSSARIQQFNALLASDKSDTSQQLLIDQIRQERSHLSQLQQSIAELQRPVGGMPLNDYLQVNAQELADLKASPDVLNFDFRRLQFERILEQESRLDAARKIESDRQKLILDQVAGERDRVSAVELSGNEQQRAILDEIATQQARMIDTQNALASLYEGLRQAEPNQVRIIEVGSQPRALDTPLFLTVVIGALAGLGLSTLGVLAIEAANDIIDTSDELKHALPVPVVDTTWNVRPADNLLGVSEPSRRQVQNNQMLSLGLIYNEGEALSKFVVVTAADESGGAGTAAANLGITLAMSGKRVVLIDAEGGPQSISQHFNMSSREGLSEFLLASDVKPRTVVPVDRYPSLGIWPLGGAEIEPGMLSSPRMLYHLNHLKEQTDILLVAAPVYRRPDALMLASEAGGVVVVVTKGVTHTRILRELLGSLKQVKANVIAAVLRSSKETGLWIDLRRVPSAGPLPQFNVAQAKTLPGLPVQRPEGEADLAETIVNMPPAADTVAAQPPAEEPPVEESLTSRAAWGPAAVYPSQTAAATPAKTQQFAYEDDSRHREDDRQLDEYAAGRQPSASAALPTQNLSAAVPPTIDLEAAVDAGADDPAAQDGEDDDESPVNEGRRFTDPS